MDLLDPFHAAFARLRCGTGLTTMAYKKVSTTTPENFERRTMYPIFPRHGFGGNYLRFTSLLPNSNVLPGYDFQLTR